MGIKGTVHKRVAEMAVTDPSQVLERMGTPADGLTHSMVRRNAERYAETEHRKQAKDSVLLRFRRAFVTPFSVVLLILAVISVSTSLILKTDISYHETSVAIIVSMILISGVIRFTQELRAKQITDHLTGMLHTTVRAMRDGTWEEVMSSELVVGDLIQLKTGDRVPADIRLTAAEDCYVSEAILTGESGIRKKTAHALSRTPTTISEYENTVFMGSALTGGSCRGIVLAVGSESAYGASGEELPVRKTGFDRGANSIAWVLIKFMLLLVPIVFLASGLTQGQWMTAFVFSLSVAVGLTPELLPMVITACMAKGSRAMGQKQTVVKNINAMQGFGSMDVLCIDKTGTLTGDAILLEYYLDILGNESQEVLDCAYLNSFFHTTGANYLDDAVVHVSDMPGKRAHFIQLEDAFRKLDELPFDYQRKSAGVLLKRGDTSYLIVKGDVDSVVSRCDRAWYRGKLIPADENRDRSVHAIVDEMMEDGMKVLAVAAKTVALESLTPEDETGLTLLGYLAFFDSPRKSARSAIQKLRGLSMDVRVLTGDHAKVAESVCRRLGISVDGMLTGSQLEQLTEDEAQIRMESTSVFAELTPAQKAQIIETLQSNGHSVGFLGDGTNDLPAELQADVGISVDTACEAVKEAADVILLKKDLNVLEEGVLEGRRSFANMNKYIRITASSNFGNICAVVVASIFLPFYPMTSLQLLLLNLLYDILCLILPWDRVDEELCRKPLDWSGRSLPRFMVYFGSISTLIDMATFAFLYFYLCPALCGGAFSTLNAASQAQFVSWFQTGWFLESMWTQVLILHLLRTRRIPFLQSRPSGLVLAVTLLGILAFTLLTSSPLGEAIGMSSLPPVYFGFLTLAVVGYLLMVTVAKKGYVRRWNELL